MSTVRNTKIDHEGVKRLEQKINKIDDEIKTISVSITSIDEQLKSANNLRDLQIKYLGDEQAEIKAVMKVHDEKLEKLENSAIITRVSKIEDYFKWMVLAIIGAVLTGLLNLIIN